MFMTKVVRMASWKATRPGFRVLMASPAVSAPIRGGAPERSAEAAHFVAVAFQPLGEGNRQLASKAAYPMARLKIASVAVS
jgi:hypothetical protein